MHRTLRPPAAKVAPAPPPSTWKVRRGRGAGAGGAGHCVWRSFLQPYVRFDASVLARFLFNRSEHKQPRWDAGGARHGNQMILAGPASRATRRDPPAHRGISDPDLTVTRAHTWTRRISTQSRRTCKWHNAQTRTAHGDQTRTNHHQLKRPQPWDNRTVVSTSVSVTPQARTGHPASK